MACLCGVLVHASALLGTFWPFLSPLTIQTLSNVWQIYLSTCYPVNQRILSKAGFMACFT